MVNIAFTNRRFWTLREVMTRRNVMIRALPSNGPLVYIYRGASDDDDDDNVGGKIPQNVTQITVDPSVRKIEDRAFCSLSSLERVIGCKSLEDIGDGSFRTCVSLVQVQLHEGLKTIGIEAFSLCFSLVDIELPRGLISIRRAAFSSCKSLRRITIPSTVTFIPGNAFSNCSALVDVQFHEGLQSIEDYAFSCCQSLSAIALPSSLKLVGESAFECCSHLTCVEFPEDAQIALEDRSFRMCNELVTLALDSVWCVRGKDFHHCAPILGYDDIIAQLRSRFVNLPVHNACYHSTQTTVDDLLSAMNSQDTELVDDFDMTPFHIVATSAALKQELLECLLERYPLDVLGLKDKCGKTMMDYLLSHNSSKSVPLVRKVLQKVFMEIVSAWCLGSKWSSDLPRRLDCVEDGDDAIEKKQNLKRTMLEYVSYCTRVEITSNLELALWKNSMNKLAKENPCSDIDRSACRWKCGANVVMDNVTEFVWSSGREAATGRLFSPLSAVGF